jgi:hypothetical protein
MGSASPHCEERHTSCELLGDIREGSGRRTGFAVSSHSGQATAKLASVLAKAAVGIPFNEHDGTLDDGEVVLYHACKLGLEGIVSKRKDWPYRARRAILNTPAQNMPNSGDRAHFNHRLNYRRRGRPPERFRFGLRTSGDIK